MPPSSQLPRGLLSHVVAVSYRAGDTVLSLTAASIYEVAPNFQFDVPLQQAPEASSADFSGGCVLPSGLPSGLSPYRRIKSVSFVGGWSTVDVLGEHITDGVRAAVHFTVEAGLEVFSGAGVSCSLTSAFYASGMAGPIPMTAGIEGELTGSAAVGGVLDSGGSIEVSAGGHTVGFPPAMLLIPDVSFGNPHFTLTAKQFAQATAGIGLTVKAGVGAGGLASLTLNVGTSLDFTAQPASCVWDAKFGQFSAEGELLEWHLSTPQTPALFTQQLGGNFCATRGSGGGSGGSGGSGSGGDSAPPGGGSNPPGGGGTGAGWTLQPIPGVSGAKSSGLGGVSCASETWCLAIGGAEETMLTEIWNGSSWVLQSSGPSVGTVSSASCTSTTWCMAVGNQDAATWNGSSWQPVAVPGVAGAESTELVSVSCGSSSSCIAVGRANFSGGEFGPLSEQWNGTNWSLLSTPTPSGSYDTELASVSCPAANSCTAVGGYDGSDNVVGVGEAFAEYWNGSAWMIQMTPNPGGGVWSGLAGVSCATTTSCVAVGYYDDGLGTSLVPLAEGWNGGSWSSTGAINPPGSEGAETAQISCSSASSCTAVGQAYAGSGAISLAEAWNGSSWSVQTTPNPTGSTYTFFNSVACPSATACVATGSGNTSPSTAFAESYSG
ncbi:MAG TPA: hypothetical protein VIJ39_07295 [Solirubrobacteraceae bacterium]